jgi:hypothetical protein
MEHDLAQFLRILAQSCAEVADGYFQLAQAAGDEVYRERVYCYELYHQMRSRWGNFPYSLGGEIDKSGHPLFRHGPYSQSKPDFLVHVPGDMGQNLAIVEVKATTATPEALLADIRKLAWFCGNASYSSAILLVYGDDVRFDALQDRLVEGIRYPGDQRISILKHVRVGSPAELVATTRLSRTQP